MRLDSLDLDGPPGTDLGYQESEAGTLVRDGRFRVSLCHRFADAEAAWRRLETSAWMSPYQGFDFLAAWQATLGAAQGCVPALIVLRDRSGIAALWPLGIERHGLLRVAVYLGGKHANYNLPVLRADLAEDDDIGDALVAAARHVGLADILLLHNQPEKWTGIPNPLLDLPHQPSASFAYSAPFAEDGDTTLRALRSGESLRKLRRSERRLADAFGPVSLERLAPDDDPEPILSAFVEQKQARMARLGLPDVFSEPGARDFLDTLATGRDGTPIADIYWLKVGDAVAATWWGITQGGRFSAMINSHDARYDRFPIGDLLLRHMIADLADRGTPCFDLGIGEAGYKTHWCPRTDRLFETIMPLTPLGVAATPAIRQWQSLKRWIKQDARGQRALAALRKWRSRPAN